MSALSNGIKLLVSPEDSLLFLERSGLKEESRQPLQGSADGITIIALKQGGPVSDCSANIQLEVQGCLIRELPRNLTDGAVAGLMSAPGQVSRRNCRGRLQRSAALPDIANAGRAQILELRSDAIQVARVRSH